MKLEDSGKRQKFETGAVREPLLGRGRYDLIPGSAMMRLAKHFENGAEKYGDRNWEKGLPLIGYLNSAARHLFKLTRGSQEEDHAGAIMWNMAAFIETVDRIIDGQLPKSLMEYISPQWKSYILNAMTSEVAEGVKVNTKHVKSILDALSEDGPPKNPDEMLIKQGTCMGPTEAAIERIDAACDQMMKEALNRKIAAEKLSSDKRKQGMCGLCDCPTNLVTGPPVEQVGDYFYHTACLDINGRPCFICNKPVYMSQPYGRNANGLAHVKCIERTCNTQPFEFHNCTQKSSTMEYCPVCKVKVINSLVDGGGIYTDSIGQHWHPSCYAKAKRGEIKGFYDGPLAIDANTERGFCNLCGKLLELNQAWVAGSERGRVHQNCLTEFKNARR